MSEESSGAASNVEPVQESTGTAVAADKGKQRDATHSAGEHRRGRGASRGKVYYRNQLDRLSTAGTKPSSSRDFKQGHPRPRGGKKHSANRSKDRTQYKEKNGQDCAEVRDPRAQGATYDGDTASLPAQQPQSVAKPEAGHTDDNEKFQGIVAGAADGTGAKRSSRSKDDRPQSRGSKGLHKGDKSEHASGERTKGERRGRHSQHGVRGPYEQTERRRDNPGYDTMYAYRYNDPSAQQIAVVHPMAPITMGYLMASQQPYYSEHFDSPEYMERNNQFPITDTGYRGYKGEAASRPKDKRKGDRRDYRNQKEDVLRALSHLNPFQSSQASALIEQLRNETYECMVCCERVRCSAAVWSCHSCYHVFHLGCVRKWAKCSAGSVSLEGESGGWRCPGCQNIAQEIPTVYRCFCGKVLDPEWRRHEGLTPHSCGELCGKKRDSGCQHRCNQLCHPGPCPSCPVMITKQCACGKTKNRMRCGQATTVLCKLVCNKLLNCFTHRCTRVCHPDSCGDCQVQVQQTCYCGKQQRDALCGTGEAGCDNMDGKSGYFSCHEKCSRTLDCGNHTCQKICHQGECTECLLKPSLVTRCPCAKSLVSDLLEDVRISCLDPVPTCESTCDKILPCSPQITEGNKDSSNEEHRCKNKCHLGECGVCDGITKVKCRCGTNVKEIPCAERTAEEYRCDQRCNKKKNCGRHRCSQKCCVDVEHRCELVCGKKLRCGYHKCLEPCHPGYCPPCLMSGFDELTCHCGATVLYPPIPCGTLPPECNKPCSRTHACSHPINHGCHSEEECPPCTFLTKKRCMGDHELRHNIPCHVKDVSCGKVCGKLLKCGHTCAKICHKPPCLGAEESCPQPCKLPRKQCGHPCAAPCHPGRECPALPCEARVTVNCKCGRRSENFPCLQGGEKMAVSQAYQRIATETLANKMKDLQSGRSVDISSIMNVDDKKPRQLECNDDCALYERNRRLAEALNIENADLSPYGKIRFSPFLVAEAKHNLAFVKSVEEALENLVETTLKMSAPQRTHSFPPMNSNQRRFVHEMAVFYNCASRSYDQEPKRNTVVTATKESRLPHVRLSSQVEKEMNPPPPQPVPFLPSRLEQPPKASSAQRPRKAQAWAQVTDYFADDFQD